jgi:hypothetical protein
VDNIVGEKDAVHRFTQIYAEKDELKFCENPRKSVDNNTEDAVALNHNSAKFR